MIASITPILVLVIGATALILGLSALFSLPVMWLWNGCLVGAIDGVHNISWLQAWGIGVLCAFLFKSWNSTSKS
jgi:hypothetical protein